MDIKIGVIGGSGIYNIKELEIIERKNIFTPFGETSDLITICNVKGKKVAFLPRHGKGHRYLPTEVPYQANIWAMKSLGVEWLISISAVGSLKETIHPKEWVIVDQLIDRTKFRNHTFFGNGLVGHIAFANPFCSSLREQINEVLTKKDVKIHKSGTYICMEGPAFSTKAESFLYKSWGADVIGMTAIPESKLSREAEMSYATIALVTDYDCWKEEEEEVSASMVVEAMKENTEKIKKYLPEIIENIDINEPSPYKGSIKNSLMSDLSLVTDETKEKLRLLYGEYFNE